ncbi:sigma-70 family RNA polymerase sigma factor [Aliifodinibius sp. S!AR15-10]|uniref:RNA polymerase sigma factor n=1 Tax=Aliifodinibius sp. S!AR15-10 TaxID=2950437 RepID=UPI00285CAD0D|nr:sigma-70 family RNA polymerase sigma factor [Aliifodinibius sp. S!AR15-10]MDR8392942.1 sigma-70 family RNA polymerase sigma factor [Aliifodinibius sp. S!AR15-10]
MTDTELWNQLKEGNRNALEALFRRYYDDLFRYGVKFCGSEVIAEDHIQELFLRVWKRRDNLGYVNGVKTYLWTALRRRLINQNNRDSRKSEIYAELGEQTSRMQFAVEEIIIQRERDQAKRKALKKAMDELTPRQREIVYLRYYEGMTYEEIETITSLNYQTIRNYVYESLKVLDEVINKPSEKMISTLLSAQLTCFLFQLLAFVI